ncbi:MAG: NifB/NifX family molybdenum-iron cluster-binding protein [Bacteroidota bacterium]
MKTVITSTGNDISSEFDQRFGRCFWFCMYDKETGQTEFIKNEYAEAQGGAGTKASQKMVELGVASVISGDFGPKAREILEKFDIQMIILPDEPKLISEIIETLQ